MYVAIGTTRQAALHADARSATANAAMTAMLDQETGVRGFINTGREAFLAPYVSGGEAFDAAQAQLSEQADGDASVLHLAAEERQAASTWRALAEVAIADVRARGTGDRYATSLSSAIERKTLMDGFRSTNAQLVARLDVLRDRSLQRAGMLSTAIVIALTALLGLLGFQLIRRAAAAREQAGAAELGYRTAQREFTDVIQVVDNESDAHLLLKRHLERSVPGARATVLNRNNSDNRLEPTTEVAADAPLAAGLEQAEPGSCVAVRLARPHHGGGDADPLLECKVCGGVPGSTSCRPLLVGGKVIGSVLVEHEAPLDEWGARVLGDTVAQAAPVLANMRTIAIAESRAATDALTGLANRRAQQDTVNRMAAHASRTVSPLAAIAIDLDHFKQINDRYGHDQGDAVLAAVGDLLRAMVRESDVAGRMGGEEFIVLAPDTGRDGAVTLAEKLRDAITRLAFPGIDDCVTASFGVACLPDDAGTAELLLRRADRALYLAKELGRNRVELAAGAAS
jgi:diguanylate cyclase (GGDEF)-like protein